MINTDFQFIKTLLGDSDLCLKPVIDFSNLSNNNSEIIALKEKINDMIHVITNSKRIPHFLYCNSNCHMFKCEEIDNNGNIMYEYTIKVITFLKDQAFGETSEFLMEKLLSNLVVNKNTPHIILPLCKFDTHIANFVKLIDKDNEKNKNFIDRYHGGVFNEKVSVCINEWCTRGTLYDFIKQHFKRLTQIHWKVIFFQLISTLAVIQSKYPSFRHNDLKASTILVEKINKDYVNHIYKVSGNKYLVPNIGYQIKLCDFDLACIPGIIDNNKVSAASKWAKCINVEPIQNRYYDLHYFFNTSRNWFFPELMTTNFDPDMKEFILKIVPEEYHAGDNVSFFGRILHNIEYVIPVDILRTSSYFSEFRVTTDQ